VPPRILNSRKRLCGDIIRDRLTAPRAAAAQIGAIHADEICDSFQPCNFSNVGLGNEEVKPFADLSKIT